MCVRIYVFKYIIIYYVHLSAYIGSKVRMRCVFTRTHARECVCVCVCMCMCTHVFMHVCARECVHMCV